MSIRVTLFPYLCSRYFICYVCIRNMNFWCFWNFNFIKQKNNNSREICIMYVKWNDGCYFSVVKHLSENTILCMYVGFKTNHYKTEYFWKVSNDMKHNQAYQCIIINYKWKEDHRKNCYPKLFSIKFKICFFLF